MALQNGGELVAHTLRREGVDTVFGLHGAHIDTIFQACVDCGVTIIDTRHEAAAGHAAEGYARTTRRMGVALVTAGGGFTNAMTPMANAFLDRTPVLFLTGSGALRDDETNTLQAGIDQVSIAKPVTKWAHRVTSADHIPRLISQAIRIANAAPRGPVLLDLPWDVLTAQVDASDAALPIMPARPSCGLSRDDAERVFRSLREASRPVIVIGSEAASDDTGRELRVLAERLGAPVFSDSEGLCALSGLPDRLYGGLVQGMFGLSREGIEPDVVLLLGLRFGLSTGHGDGKLIPRGARILQLDPDAREIGRLQPVEMGLVTDVGCAIKSLAEIAWTHDAVRKDDWLAGVRAHVQRRHDHVFESVRSDPERPLHPLDASRVVASHVDENTVVVADGALTYLWLTEVISQARPANFLCHGYLGSMGVGFGIALGAQAACAASGKRTILVTGDGAVGYSLAEFDSAVRHGLPLIVVVMNNRSWGATLHFQQAAAGPDRITHTRLENGRYHDVASAFDADGYLATNADELHAALASALASNRPACINVLVDLNPVPPEELFIMGMDPLAPAPMAAPGQSVHRQEHANMTRSEK
ncbi:thiamine pyrophosphate-binding protein [Burkholderia sp. SRS-46]|nr:thiamine pyrophosphate-binding protein [Burkholderia sp. SRS-46]